MNEWAYGEAVATLDRPVRERINAAVIEPETALDQRGPVALADLIETLIERVH